MDTYFNYLRLYSDEISRLMNLHKIVGFPTREVNTLDLLFTNFSIDQRPNRHTPIRGKFDHACVFWSRQITRLSLSKRRIRKFSMSSIISFHKFVSTAHCFSVIHDIDDLDQAFFSFLECIRCIFDIFFPLKFLRKTF